MSNTGPSAPEGTEMTKKAPHSSGLVAPELDISAVPWSARGSYMTLSSLAREVDHPGRDKAVEPGLYLFDVSGSRFFGDWNGVFRLQGLAGGAAVDLSVRSATPSMLVLEAAGGTVEIDLGRHRHAALSRP